MIAEDFEAASEFFGRTAAGCEKAETTMNAATPEQQRFVELMGEAAPHMRELSRIYRTLAALADNGIDL